VRLSDSKVRSLKRKDKRYEVADGHGLFIEVQPSGERVWRFRYRLNSRREKVTIGPYPAIPIADKVVRGKVETKGARTIHAEYRAMVAAGQSPTAHKRTAKAKAASEDATVAGFAKRYDRERLATLKRPEQSRQRLKRYVTPAIGNRQLDSLTRDDILAIVDPIKDAGSIQEARHTLNLLWYILDHAMERGLIERNVAREIKMKTIGPATSRDRVLTTHELGKLLRALDQAAFLNPALRHATGLLLLTMCRKGELVNARWEHVDLDEALWSIPDNKGGNPHSVPLSPQALDLFKALRLLAGESAYVLPRLIGSPAHDKPMSESTLNWAIKQLTVDRDGKPALLSIPAFTLHDFRRAASTYLHGMGRYNSDVIEKALGHAIRGVRGVYNKAAYISERTAMLNEWANALEAMKVENVVHLQAKAA
jgi:integrase